MIRLSFRSALRSIVLGLAACGDTSNTAERVDATAGLDAGYDSSPGDAAYGDVSSALDAVVPVNDAQGVVPSCVRGGANDDVDQDGFTPAQGDCEDCSNLINPAALDFPMNGFDEDCLGGDAPQAALECDNGIDIASDDPNAAARAMGFCKRAASNSDWGLVSARYTRVDGTSEGLMHPMRAGILPKFGAAEPRAGLAMLGLSSGLARAPGQPGWVDSIGCVNEVDPCNDTTGCLPPSGFPVASKRCTDAGWIVTPDPKEPVFDQVALEVRFRAPSNANSFSFDSMFYTHEYPKFLCTQYNDHFVVLKEPVPTGAAGANVLFDANRDPITVNSALLAVCNPNLQSRNTNIPAPCGQGTALLQGTGFSENDPLCGSSVPGASHDTGASTGWLRTNVPVAPGELITLRFALWDVGDNDVGSTALIDNFQWSIDQPVLETVPIVLF